MTCMDNIIIYLQCCQIFAFVCVLCVCVCMFMLHAFFVSNSPINSNQMPNSYSVCPTFFAQFNDYWNSFHIIFMASWHNVVRPSTWLNELEAWFEMSSMLQVHRAKSMDDQNCARMLYSDNNKSCNMHVCLCVCICCIHVCWIVFILI